MNTKSFLTSKTLWGLVIAAVGALLSHFHVTLTDADVNGLTGDITEAAGILVAAYGRVVATQPLHVTSPTTPTA